MYRIPYENEQITKTIAAPYAPVDFTEEEKEQFRENIGAGSGSGGGRNLLDNPFFTINQRNITTTSHGSYLLDRWKAYFNQATVTYSSTDHSVTLANINNVAYILQPLETQLVNDLKNKTITFAAIIDGVEESASFVFTAASGVVNYAFLPCGASVYWDSDNGNLLGIRNGVLNKTIKVTACGIFVGTISTLANDAPPNFVEELHKCQYYFYALPGIAGVQCDAAAISTTYMDAFLAIEMRPVDPTVTFANLKVYNGNAITRVLGYKRGVGEQLRFQSTGLVAGQVYFVVQADGTIPKIWVSAEL